MVGAWGGGRDTHGKFLQLYIYVKKVLATEIKVK